MNGRDLMPRRIPPIRPPRSRRPPGPLGGRSRSLVPGPALDHRLGDRRLGDAPVQLLLVPVLPVPALPVPALPAHAPARRSGSGCRQPGAAGSC